MKKRLIIAALVAIGVCTVVCAQEVVKITVPSASTNAAAIASDIQTNDANAWVDGYVDAVSIDLGNTLATTVTVTLATQGDTGSGPSRTIYTGTDIEADQMLYPRVYATTTTGSAVTNFTRIPLSQDRLVLSAYARTENTNETVSVDAYIFLTH